MESFEKCATQLQEKLDDVVNCPSAEIPSQQITPAILSDDDSTSRSQGGKAKNKAYDDASDDGKSTYRDFSRVLPRQNHHMVVLLLGQPSLGTTIWTSSSSFWHCNSLFWP
jgi:hypothetical protein